MNLDLNGIENLVLDRTQWRFLFYVVCPHNEKKDLGGFFFTIFFLDNLFFWYILHSCLDLNCLICLFILESDRICNGALTIRILVQLLMQIFLL